uniref:Uncharacterized protein n=1 Tax=Ciona intestinalis TaxID=7719 RepID=H2XM44_CIOIN
MNKSALLVLLLLGLLIITNTNYAFYARCRRRRMRYVYCMCRRTWGWYRHPRSFLCRRLRIGNQQKQVEETTDLSTSMM